VGIFIVHQSGHPDRIYDFAGDLIIGRDGDAKLVLPNVSVSRHHAQVVRDTQGRLCLQDMGSGNGTLLNQEQLISGELRPLKSGDGVQLGTFRLTFLQGDRAKLVHQGRYVQYMPTYDPSTDLSSEEATFGLDRKTLLRMAEIEHRAENARLVAEATHTHWEPEKREVYLGSSSEITAPGFFVAARAAQILWDGREHVLKALRWWSKVYVNGVALSGPHRMRHGDRIRLGKTRFRYEVPPNERLERARGRRERVSIPSSRTRPTAPSASAPDPDAEDPLDEPTELH